MGVVCPENILISVYINYKTHLEYCNPLSDTSGLIRTTRLIKHLFAMIKSAWQKHFICTSTYKSDLNCHISIVGQELIKFITCLNTNLNDP